MKHAYKQGLEIDLVKVPKPTIQRLKHKQHLDIKTRKSTAGSQHNRFHSTLGDYKDEEFKYHRSASARDGPQCHHLVLPA
jgi:hypothetical protein